MNFFRDFDIILSTQSLSSKLHTNSYILKYGNIMLGLPVLFFCDVLQIPAAQSSTINHFIIWPNEGLVSLHILTSLTSRAKPWRTDKWYRLSNFKLLYLYSRVFSIGCVKTWTAIWLEPDTETVDVSYFPIFRRLHLFFLSTSFWWNDISSIALHTSEFTVSASAVAADWGRWDTTQATTVSYEKIKIS